MCTTCACQRLQVVATLEYGSHTTLATVSCQIANFFCQPAEVLILEFQLCQRVPLMAVKTSRDENQIRLKTVNSR